MQYAVRTKTSYGQATCLLCQSPLSDLCAISKFSRLLKHPRNDCESESCFEDVSKLKARSAAFVAVSEADVDASKRPITVKNAEKATSVFCAVMGFLLASTSATETATKSCTFVAVSEADMPARNPSQ